MRKFIIMPIAAAAAALTPVPLPTFEAGATTTTVNRTTRAGAEREEEGFPWGLLGLLGLLGLAGLGGRKNQPDVVIDKRHDATSADRTRNL